MLRVKTMPMQRLSKVIVFFMTTCFLASVAPVMAHHSHAMFDAETEITISGKVAGLRYANPHVRLLVEAENEAGEIERWDVEMSTIVNMRTRGVNRSTFPQGADISLVVNPLRDGGQGGNLVHINSINGVENSAESGNWAPST